jgi:CHAT domain-containing protein
LYTALFNPIEALIKDKHHLLLVPSTSLTALPFNLLVTQRPMMAVSQIKDIARYRDASWLLNRHAVTVLPSVANLKALRVFAHQNRAAKSMIGFGDPVFRREQFVVAAEERLVTPEPDDNSRAFTGYWSGASINREKLSQELRPLPETADELKAVAGALNASASDIILGEAATEARVKEARLADYRIVYFATHGLVAGDVEGLDEPSLALTLPKNPTDFDDGLLTASEIAQLKLNADWVVLSACNTIAGDKPGAEALSGLARAFFYAGARAILVSHWAVDSKAAASLAVATFDIMKTDAEIGRAEALRRAMINYMNDASTPWNAYPAFWGPFAIVGEGAAQ